MVTLVVKQFIVFNIYYFTHVELFQMRYGDERKKGNPKPNMHFQAVDSLIKAG